MKTRTLLCTAVAIALSAGGGAYAQGNPTNDSIAQQRGRDLGPSRGDPRQVQRGPAPGGDAHRDNRPGYSRDHRENYARDDRRGPGRHGDGPGYGGRGAGPDHSYYRGGRLPREYRSRTYVVDDWRGHHLSAPPRGYHWVQTGSDYVLVAIATGIIAQILLSQ